MLPYSVKIFICMTVNMHSKSYKNQRFKPMLYPEVFRNCSNEYMHVCERWYQWSDLLVDRLATMMKKSLNLQLYPYMWFQASWFKFKVRLHCIAVNFSVLNVDISNVMYKLKWVWSLNHCSIITLNLWVTWILEYLENNLWSIGFDIMRFYCLYHSLRPWSFPLEPH